jgi:hypothetical protein
MGAENNIEFKVTTTVDPDGLKQTSTALKDLTEQTNGANEAGKKGKQTDDEATNSKHALKDALKGLKAEFPGLGKAIEFATNPITLMVAVMSMVIAKGLELKQRLENLFDGMGTETAINWMKDYGQALRDATRAAEDFDRAMKEIENRQKSAGDQFQQNVARIRELAAAEDALAATREKTDLARVDEAERKGMPKSAAEAERVRIQNRYGAERVARQASTAEQIRGARQDAETQAEMNQQEANKRVEAARKGLASVPNLEQEQEILSARSGDLETNKGKLEERRKAMLQQFGGNEDNLNAYLGEGKVKRPWWDVVHSERSDQLYRKLDPDRLEVNQLQTQVDTGEKEFRAQQKRVIQIAEARKTAAARLAEAEGKAKEVATDRFGLRNDDTARSAQFGVQTAARQELLEREYRGVVGGTRIRAAQTEEVDALVGATKGNMGKVTSQESAQQFQQLMQMLIRYNSVTNQSIQAVTKQLQEVQQIQQQLNSRQSFGRQ